MPLWIWILLLVVGLEAAFCGGGVVELPQGRQMGMSAPIVICRSAVAPEPLDPRNRTGYRCHACNKPLQVSLTGVAQIARGGTPLCNACGGEIIESMKDREGSIALNPAAIEYLKRKGEDPDSWFPAQPNGPLTEVECPLCGREHSARQGDRVDCACGMSFQLAKAAGV